MARCSLVTPKAYPLLSCSELDSLLLFERVAWDWVREVHRHSSITKKGKIFVVFRNSKNEKFLRFKQLIIHLELAGYDVSCLENAEFKSDKNPDLIANKVGANKIAKIQAQDWIKDIEEKKITSLENQKKNVQQ